VDAALKEMGKRFDEIFGRMAVSRSRRNGCCAPCCCSCSTRFRSERMLMEQLEYNLVFRLFVGLLVSDLVWHPTVFSKNRERLLRGGSRRVLFSRAV
jgi:transposase